MQGMVWLAAAEKNPAEADKVALQFVLDQFHQQQFNKQQHYFNKPPVPSDVVLHTILKNTYAVIQKRHGRQHANEVLRSAML